MAIAIKHAFVSLKGDGTDATLVQPSQWNATHSTSMATGNILGRVSAGAGAFEELPASAAIIAALGSADGLTFLNSLGLGGFRTGDGKFTLQTTAETGWVMADDGTFGDAASGGTTRANADTQNLFTLLYTLPDAYVPIFTSAGTATTRGAQGTAATAFGAHCRMSLPKVLGRAMAAAGSGAGLTARALASFVGEEAHQITANEMYPHTHSGSGVTGTENQQHNHGYGSFSQASGSGVGGGGAFGTPGSSTTATENQQHNHNFSFTTDTGSGVNGAAHNNMQPTTFWNVEIKL